MNEEVKEAACENCLFSVEVGIHKEGLRKIYQCRRYPPTAFLMVGPNQRPQTLSEFPIVQGDSFCGEHQIVYEPQQ